MLIPSVIEFLKVASNLVVALLMLTRDFISTLFDRLYLSFLALDIRLNLSHLIMELVKWSLDLFTFPP